MYKEEIVKVVTLTNSEIDTIETLLYQIENLYENESDPRFLEQSQQLATKLPGRVLEALIPFKQRTGEEIFVISGFPIDQEKVGLTPLDLETNPNVSTKKECFLFCLLSAAIGDVFGWATQQDGRFVHDIFPIKGHEQEQISSGSDEVITLHIEDAFHEHRADFIGLMCIRNPNEINTTFSKPKLDALSAEHRELLFHQEYIIRPDNSHLEKYNNGLFDDGEIQAAREKVNEEMSKGIKFAPFFGDKSRPFLRLDRYFMDEAQGEYGSALNSLCDNLEVNTFGLALKAGDIAFVDNYRILHGRCSFNALYDGNDRWLKRVNIKKELTSLKKGSVFLKQRII
ncbi:hypothetical protein CWB89_19330 [Pseudoalteromonas piscicida]|uniref:TauD/TfdA-like domain-containing protein n=1 Tax=Pseudoalteromonas piscicida TaxID=43662 RepID=A0AAQ2ITY9_PSEO7|nr:MULTISPECIES: guanitoxin biosynthesis L-enduracididine beta-hydroxylase GntD [Pseudoalteromonas]TMN42061.1 hypothetical protein CWB94_05850 [Pseudoalteromonas piscicida]TMN44519.1 hypothetical protein CWB95_03595 [Pseudoalteromonas piscicida]TMN47751.1 hypothetical protein CWB91_20215 [Pseudoalteromonas piscicida]TMN48525.1 hypothetical protein CWB92_17305 [Pseudoalteromonas piscicida]TMN56978.1 hypothetical protein CWB93_09850 [Pseudoalteromonas piscicida]